MSWKHSSGAEGMQNVILWDAVPGASANRLFKLNEQRQNLCCLLQPGPLEGNAGDCSPIAFSHALDYSGNQEISRQLDHVRRRRVLVENKRLLSHRVEKHLAALDLCRGASDNNEELRGLSRLGTAKHRSSDIVLLPFAVGCLESS